MQRQVQAKMPITSNIGMPSLDIISEDLMLQYVESLGIQTENDANNMNAEVAQSILNYQKPKVATLNCFVKPNTDTKMLMISPTNKALSQN